MYLYIFVCLKEVKLKLETHQSKEEEFSSVGCRG